MPRRVVVVHDDEGFLAAVTGALTRAHYDACSFLDPESALRALRASETVDLLISRIAFSAHQPVGLSLARVARVSVPGLKVLFIALPNYRGDALGLGEFLAAPVSPTKVLRSVVWLLESW